MHLLTLSDNWFIQTRDTFQAGAYTASDETWHSINVPGHWQQQPGLEDYAGKVVYLCQFTLPNLTTEALPKPVRTWLRIRGIFYWSHPYLNGVDLGLHEGYFDPYEHDITTIVKHNNTLIIEVDCPDEHNKLNKRMITGVFSHWDCIDPHTNPGGIWLPVEIHQSGPVRLQSVRCHTETANDIFAQLHYSVDLDSVLDGSIILRWTIAPRTYDGETQIIEQRRRIKAQTQTIRGMLKVREPRLWWTHDLGTPDLYSISLDVLWDDRQISDSTTFDFGIRRFELRDWIPYLNGTRFLIKGSNYAPGDTRIATMNATRCTHDVHLARDCNMNLLRIHAHVEHPDFYTAANEAGLLLWQDMPLQWLYQAKILTEAQRQVKAMVHMLYNHPSVAIWCMHNEPFYVGETSNESLPRRLRTYQSAFGFSWNRDVLDTYLKRNTEHEDPSRPVIRSSGEFSVPRLREGTDTHIYFGWYKAYGSLQEVDRLRKVAISNFRFVTEFGAQSFPNVESCRKFLPADVKALDPAYLASHHSFQPDIMSYWVPWQDAQSFDELVAMTQEYQMKVNRFYIDRLRYHKYRPTGGIVPFMFCDPYPAILWSIVDYWRQPKRSYYAMQMAFSPQYLFTLIAPGPYRVAEHIELPLYVVNDAHTVMTNIHVTAILRDPDGTDLATIEHTGVILDADSLPQEIDRLRLTPDRAGCYTLELTMTGGMQHVHHVYTVNVKG